MKEVWRDIHTGTHMVSNLGRIYSHHRFMRVGHGGYKVGGGSILSLHTTPLGYKTVTLSGSKPALVHRLVAYAFLPAVEGKPFINHIDGVKTNNNVDNLEWCTHEENMRHAWETGLIKSEKPIRNIDTGDVYTGLQAAARHFGKSAGNLHSALNGKQKTWAGYHWEYASE